MMKKYKPLEEPFMVSAEDRNRIQLMLMRKNDLSCYAREVEEEVYGQEYAPSTCEKEKAEDAKEMYIEALEIIESMTRDLVYNKKLNQEPYVGGFYDEREIYNYGKEKEEWPYWEDPGEEN